MPNEIRKLTTKLYDDVLRDPRSKEFYNSPEWKRARALKLSRTPLCETCLLNDVIEPAVMVHHTLPILKFWDERLNLKYMVSLCTTCHGQIEADKPNV